MFNSFQLFDRIRAFAKKGNIFRTDNLYQDQTALDRAISGGSFIDFSRQSALLEQTNLQINRLERYKDYDMMDETGEITLALNLFADESSLVDSEKKHSVIVKSKNDRIRKIIEDFLYNTLLIDRELRPIIRYLCKYGDFAAEVVPTYNRDGVASFRFINVYNFTRIHTKFGDLVGFFYQDPTSLQPIFLHPWQVIHLRLTSYENAYSPYGRSVIDGGRKDFKRLRLMEDAALVYRLERAAEKLVFSIPVGNIPPKEVPQYIELIARQFKKHKFVDTSTGMVNERYNPLIQNDNIFLPKRADGTGPTIDTLPGAENLDQIADIEYFKKKMVAGLNIPFSRLGIGDTKDPDGKSLAQASPEFAKNIQWIQREVVIGLKKLCIIHLALRGHTINDIKNFDLYMTAASAIDELYRIEVWNTRADVMANLKEIGWFPPEWIIERFTDLSPDEIRQMKSIRSELGVKEESTDADERRLLTEYKEFEERVAANPIKDDIQEDSISYLINANELDGLSRPGSNGSGATKLLVESTVPSNLSEEAIEETRKIIIGDEDNEEIEVVAAQVS